MSYLVFYFYFLFPLFFLAFKHTMYYEKLSRYSVCHCYAYTVVMIQHLPTVLFSLWLGRCPHGWYISPNNTKCYGFMSSSQPWNESETQCNRFGGNLAAPITYQEFSFAQNLCNRTLGGCWVGGRVLNSSDGFVWKWSDNVSKWNDSILPSTALQSNCKNVSCRMNNLVETCSLIFSGPGTPFLKVEKCNTSHPFICMLNTGMALSWMFWSHYSSWLAMYILHVSPIHTHPHKKKKKF